MHKQKSTKEEKEDVIFGQFSRFSHVVESCCCSFPIFFLASLSLSLTHTGSQRYRPTLSSFRGGASGKDESKAGLYTLKRKTPFGKKKKKKEATTRAHAFIIIIMKKRLQSWLVGLNWEAGMKRLFFSSCHDKRKRVSVSLSSTS